MLSEEQLVPFFKSSVCRGPGSNRDHKVPGAETLPTELAGHVIPCVHMKVLYMHVKALNVTMLQKCPNAA